MMPTVNIMSHTYYCVRCGKTASTASPCPTCKSPMQRALRVMEPAELVEQLTLFDEQGGRNKRSHPHLRVIRGGKAR